MWAGLAGGLLVFTGIWHATEFLMGGRTADTRRLIPVGIVAHEKDPFAPQYL